MIASTADEFVNLLRQELDDKYSSPERGDGDCLWKDAELYQYSTEAIHRVMEDTRTTQRRVVLPFEEGQASIRRPAYLRRIVAAHLLSTGHAVRVGSMEDYARVTDKVDALGATGAPAVVMLEMYPGRIHFVPTPHADDSLVVLAEVVIDLPLEAGLPLPQFTPREIRCAMHYAKSVAYRKQDAETYDKTQADTFGALYNSEIIDAELMSRTARREAGTIRSSW